MAFDPQGRLWVAVWPSYPGRTPTDTVGDKLLVFEDTNNDGQADKVTTFLDDLNCPTGFQFYKDGVLVMQAPDLWFVRDTDGDGKADWKERVLMGLDSADTHHTANSMVLDPGGATYLSDGVFHRSQVETATGPVRNEDGCIYRYEPLTGKFERYAPYGFANPHGRVFDRWGTDIITDATGNRSYFGPAISGYLDYPAKHEQIKEIWDRPARPSPGTGMLSSRHFPEEFQGNFLNCNVLGFQGIYRVKLSPDGAGLKGEKLEDLVQSTDPNFRPVAAGVAPDGSLYFLDWAKPLIGHMQHHLRDPNRDKTHGRIYRITYEGRPLLKPAAIAGQPIPKLLDLLKTPEDDVRTRVKIELGKHDSAEVIAAVKKWTASLDAKDKDYEHHLTEALWVHQWHNIVNEELLRRMLRSPDHRARAAATRVLCYWRDRVNDPLALLEIQARDDSPRVRLEAVRACSFFKSARAAEIVLTVLDKESDPEEPDYYLQYSLNESMRALDKYLVNQFTATAEADGAPLKTLSLPKSPQAAAYVLGRLSDQELIAAPRSEFVFTALLQRPGLDRKYRFEALEGLARLRNTDVLTELLATLEELDRKRGRSWESVLRDLSPILLQTQPATLAAKRPALVKLATGANRPLTRQMAYAAIINADAGVTRVWAETAADARRFADLLLAIPLVRDANLRANLYPKVAPLLDQRGAPFVRRAAITAIASLPGHEAESFNLLAALVKSGTERATAIASLQRIPRSAWPVEAAAPLLECLLTYLQGVPADERTEADASNAFQFASDLAALLPPERAAAFGKRLRALGVSVFVLRAIPEQMLYDKTLIVVEAGKPVEIVLINDDTMPHNLVITAPGALEEIGNAAEKMSLAPDAQGRVYVPDSPKVLHATRMVESGRQVKLSFTAPTTPGDYPYVCTYPGHWRRMTGTLAVVPDVEAYLASHAAAQQPKTTEWKTDDLEPALAKLQIGRNLARGHDLFTKLACASCHKFGSEGMDFGPELTTVFAQYQNDPKEVLRHIIEPSLVISNRYRSIQFELKNGDEISGLIIKDEADSLTVQAGASASLIQTFKKSDIQFQQPLNSSVMPPGLLNQLSADEILDLLAFLKSGGQVPAHEHKH
jgi:putative heme-binding domain-containing protein